MNKLKIMTQYKECSVVLLDTTEKSKIALFIDTLEFAPEYYILEKGRVQPKYLYVLSNDEIKEGDFKDYLNGKVTIINNKIVIATTNPELIQQGVSTVSDEWLQEYCSNPVDKVLVEYEGDWDEFYKAWYAETVKPKLVSNTISIKPKEDTWDDIFEKFIATGKLAIFFKEWLKEHYKTPQKK